MGPPADAADAAELYGLPAGEFVAARDALAKRLRAEGDRDEAARVGKLRRPPVTAWALNTVARQEPALVAAVLDAGAGLRAATERALGGDASAMRGAQAAERRAVEAATSAAAEQMAAAGHAPSEVARQRMASTLRAAAADPAVAGLLRYGVLDGDRDAPGFSLDLAAAAVALRPAPDASVAPPAAEAAAPVGGAAPPPRDDEAARAAQEAQEADRAAKEAARARRRVEEKVGQLEQDAERLRRRADQLRADAGEADRRARQLHAAAEKAAGEAENVERRLEEARRELDARG